MSEANEANKALVRRYIEVINAGTLDRLEEFIAPEYVNHTTATRGPEGYRQAHIQWRAAFPDFHVTIEQMIAEGDLVAVRMTWSGTHHGEFRGIAPTGNHVRWPAMMFRRISHGMVVEGWGGGDRWRLCSELGAVPTSS